MESDQVELPADGLVDYVRQLDTEQNERLQEEEQEIVRLWNARKTVLDQLDACKPCIPSPIDENASIAETLSAFDDNESVLSRQTDCPKVIERYHKLPESDRSVCVAARPERAIQNSSHQLFDASAHSTINALAAYVIRQSQRQESSRP